MRHGGIHSSGDPPRAKRWHRLQDPRQATFAIVRRRPTYTISPSKLPSSALPARSHHFKKRSGFYLKHLPAA